MPPATTTLHDHVDHQLNGKLDFNLRRWRREKKWSIREVWEQLDALGFKMSERTVADWVRAAEDVDGR